MQYVSVNFSTNTAPIGTKLDTRSQWAPTMLVLQLIGNSPVYRELGLGVDTILEKTVFFDTFFTNRLRGSTLHMLLQGQWVKRVAPLVTAPPPATNWPCPFCARHYWFYSFGFFRLCRCCLRSKRRRIFLDFGYR